MFLRGASGRDQLESLEKVFQIRVGVLSTVRSCKTMVFLDQIQLWAGPAHDQASLGSLGSDPGRDQVFLGLSGEDPGQDQAYLDPFRSDPGHDQASLGPRSTVMTNFVDHIE